MTLGKNFEQYCRDTDYSVEDILPILVDQTRQSYPPPATLGNKSFLEQLEKDPLLDELFARYHQDKQLFRGRTYEVVIRRFVESRRDPQEIAITGDLAFRYTLRLWNVDPHDIEEDAYGDPFVREVYDPDYYTVGFTPTTRPTILKMGEATLTPDDRPLKNERGFGGYFCHKVEAAEAAKIAHPETLKDAIPQFVVTKGHQFLKKNVRELVEGMLGGVEIISGPVRVEPFNQWAETQHQTRDNNAKAVASSRLHYLTMAMSGGRQTQPRQYSSSKSRVFEGYPTSRPIADTGSRSLNRLTGIYSQ